MKERTGAAKGGRPGGASQVGNKPGQRRAGLRGPHTPEAAPDLEYDKSLLAIDALPVKERLALVLMARGQSELEVARLLDLPDSTIRSYRQRHRPLIHSALAITYKTSEEMFRRYLVDAEIVVLNHLGEGDLKAADLVLDRVFGKAQERHGSAPAVSINITMVDRPDPLPLLVIDPLPGLLPPVSS